MRIATMLFSLAAMGLIGCSHFADDNGQDPVLGVKPAEYDEPLFVFAVIADTHLPDSRLLPPHDDHRYLKALSIAEALLINCVEDINNHSPAVRFTVVLGDISDNGKGWELNRAAEILGELNGEYYPVVGNHDNFRDDNKAAWKAAFGYDSTSYVFTCEGFRFIVIDPTLDPFDPPDHMVRFDENLRNWVRSQLDQYPDAPSFLINHYPLLNRCWNAGFQTYHRAGQNCLEAKARSASESEEPYRRGLPPDEEKDFYKVYEGGTELRAILEGHGNVIASINGHVHANRAEEHNGVVYIDVGATLVGRPSIRYFYVYARRVEVNFEYISNDSLFAHVSGMCPHCTSCTHPNAVCSFIDGRIEDKRLAIHF
jgi:predicted phosphodiesterase